ncbi:MAG: DUF4173 domain-containing protein, partial [Pyrinomonadaceae bacterium]
RPETILSHIAIFGVFAWMSAGYFRGVLIAAAGLHRDFASANIRVVPAPENQSKVERVRQESGEYPVTLPGHLSVVDHLNVSDPPDVSDEKSRNELPDVEEKSKPWTWSDIDNSLVPQTFTFGTIEIGVILGIVNLLFLSFVAVQIPYLFGGIELVHTTSDFKLADYARRGFGELVAVSALVLPILLISHWLVRKENSFTEKLFRILAVIQIGLLFVIMASAAQRLILLTGELGYGLTTIRLYPMIFMIWLAIVFVWFSVTVLRGARRHFAWGALWSAFFILGATHFLNPDEYIVRTNIALMREGREFDIDYNSQLSDDAVPVLFEVFSEINSDGKETVKFRLAHRYCKKQTETDLRSLNLARVRAWEILDANKALVESIGGCESENIWNR